MRLIDDFELKRMYENIKIKMREDIANSKMIICIRDAHTKEIIGISNNINILEINCQGMERMPCSDVSFLKNIKISKKILNKARKILKGAKDDRYM